MRDVFKAALVAALAIGTAPCAAKVLPETLFIVQSQLYPWREQARGYLMRYPNQPLLVEPDLPYDEGEEGVDHWIAGWGSFPSQADYDRTASLVKDYGMDGLQIFWGRPAKSFLAAKNCPVKAPSADTSSPHREKPPSRPVGTSLLCLLQFESFVVSLCLLYD